MTSSILAKTLSEAVLKPANEGLYTHAYAAYGRLDLDQPVHEFQLSPDGRDIFDLASMTKALVTTPLVFADIVAGRLGLDDTVKRWLQAFGVQKTPLDQRLLELTIRSLLRHESGLPAWRNFWVNHLGLESAESLARPEFKAQRLVEGLNRAAADIKSETKSVYSDVGFLLLGYILEVAHKADLSVQFERLCDELHIPSRAQHIGYTVQFDAADLAARAVPSAQCNVRGRLLQGEVHDENCASLGGVTAHAGLFGTGRAVAGYLAALARSQIGRRLIADNSAARMSPPNDALLGWRQGADPSSETFGGGMAMGHMGFVGTAFWVCPERSDYAIFLTNRVISGRMRPGIAAARREVFQSLSGFRT